MHGRDVDPPAQGLISCGIFNSLIALAICTLSFALPSFLFMTYLRMVYFSLEATCLTLIVWFDPLHYVCCDSYRKSKMEVGYRPLEPSHYGFMVDDDGEEDWSL